MHYREGRKDWADCRGTPLPLVRMVPIIPSRLTYDMLYGSFEERGLLGIGGKGILIRAGRKVPFAFSWGRIEAIMICL